MVNIVGPFGAGINETTTRPPDQKSGLTLDTWFKNCAPGVRQSGTIPTHIFLNKVTALLRRAIRGMGVDEDELDDDMLLKALLRGKLNFENVGLETSVHHDFNVGTNAHRIRSIKGVNINVAIEPGTGAIILTGEMPAVPFAEIAPMMIVEEQRAGAASPLAMPQGGSVQRPLNTVVVNQIPGASLEGNQITVPAGTYRIKYMGCAYSAGSHHTRLMNVDTGTMLSRSFNGDSQIDRTSDDFCNATVGITRQTFAVETTLALRQHSQGNVPGRIGAIANISPDYHVDAWIQIIKEA